jgi:hypothetical protein
MTFYGVGMVKHGGVVIANFVDGKFETNESRVILRLKSLKFSEVPAVSPEVQEPVKKPVKKRKAK